MPVEKTASPTVLRRRRRTRGREAPGRPRGRARRVARGSAAHARAHWQAPVEQAVGHRRAAASCTHRRRAACAPVPGVVARPGLRRVAVDRRPSRSGSTSVRLAGSPAASGRPWPVRPRDPGRAARTSTRATSAQLSRPRTDQHVGDHRQRGLQAEHAEGRDRRSRAPCRARACGAWSVATASIVPSAQRRAQRLDVLGGPQRRVDLVDRVVAASAGRWSAAGGAG